MSNLFKSVCQPNDFVIQFPLQLDQCWTILCLDMIKILESSGLYPPTFELKESHTLKAYSLNSTLNVRGIFTSDNLYQWHNLPSEMTFKAPSGVNRDEWESQFTWTVIPCLDEELAKSHAEQISSKKNLVEQELEDDINILLNKSPTEFGLDGGDLKSETHESHLQSLEELKENLIKDKSMRESELVQPQEEKKQFDSPQRDSGALNKSEKMKNDPILELEHIIGYNGQTCKDLQWSRLVEEKSILFATGGTLVAMDVEHSKQRFFFGHSEPICCFTFSNNGSMIASGQEGLNPMIRIWDYLTGRCIAIISTEVAALKCLSFSPDGNFLTSVGKDQCNRELLIVWDISGILEDEKPTILAKQVSDFNILSLKFSPYDSFKMASCGKENIRFWRIKNSYIQGSAIVLNQHA